MDEKQKVPVVRFKGFTGDWERRKLGEVFKEYSEKNHPELPPLTIVQGRGTVLREDSERALQYDKSSLPSYKLVNKDDFIVHLRSFEGGLEKATTQGIISPAYHTFHGEGTDSRFYYAYFRSQKFINHDLFPYVYGIRDGRSIDIDGMKKIRLPFPSYAEQKKIGDFIDTIDGYSTLHQQKLDQLKKLKAYFLQNLFPAKGEKVPKIRFKGFTGEWEQRKILEIADRYDNQRIPITANLRVHGNTPYYGANGIQDYVDGYTHDGEFVLVAEDGANDLKNYPVHYVNGRIWVNNHAHVLQAKEKVADNKFLSNAVSQADIETVLVGGGRAKLNAEALMNIDLSIPSKIEQERIGTFLSLFDTIITLHQRKLEALQTLKKFLLQNLFV